MKNIEKKNDLIPWDDHLNNKYGNPGTQLREKYEEEFDVKNMKRSLKLLKLVCSFRKPGENRR